MEDSKDVFLVKMAYNKSVYDYIHLFEEKHGRRFEGWVGGVVGEELYFGGNVLNFSDLKLDLDYDCETDLIWGWFADNEGHDQYINYSSYIMGMRHKYLKE